MCKTKLENSFSNVIYLLRHSSDPVFPSLVCLFVAYIDDTKDFKESSKANKTAASSIHSASKLESDRS
jgi:hypothetical protein